MEVYIELSQLDVNVYFLYWDFIIGNCCACGVPRFTLEACIKYLLCEKFYIKKYIALASKAHRLGNWGHTTANVRNEGHSSS